MSEIQTKKGVKTKLFGVLLIILGALDSMLSWRGGFGAGSHYLVLIAAGMALNGFGAVRQRGQTIDQHGIASEAK